MNRIAVRLEPGDYVAAQHLHTRWTSRQLLVHASALIAGALLAGLNPPTHWLFVLGCGLIGGALGGAGFREISRRLVLPRRARKLFAQQKSLQRPIEFWWDEQALHWANEDSNGRTRWSDYIKRREDDRIVLLYLSDLMFQMIPKRCLEEPAQRQEFLQRAAMVDER